MSGDFFRVLGVEPILGRVFTAADDRHGCGLPGAVMSYGFWQRHFGGDSAVIGRSLPLNTRQVEVIGVTPAAFSGLEVGRAYDIAIPICSHDTIGSEEGWLRSRDVRWLTVLGRMAPGQTLKAVNAQLASTSAAFISATVPYGSTAQEIGDYRSFRLRAISGSSGVSAVRGRYSGALSILLVTTGLVLLIACANLANLILARASARERESAVRLAIGASHGRLVRQFMVENGLLALGGAAAGLLVAGLLSRLLVRFLGAGLSLELRFDGRLLAFVVAVTGLCCLTFGLIPAWRASRLPAAHALRGRGLSAGRHSLALRRALVMAQVALSLVLLFGALLFTGTLRNLLAVDAGFQTRGIAVARVDYSQLRVPASGRAALKRRVLDQIRSAPGVTSVAEVRHVPLGGTGSSLDVWRDSRDPVGKITVRLNGVSEGYLQTMGIRLIAGRDLNSRDTSSSPRVAIVNPVFARLLGLQGTPVGQTFRAEGSPSEPEVVYEIVGLVPETKYFALREDSLPIVFLPMTQIADPRSFTDFVVRSGVPMGDPSSAVRRAVSAMSPLMDVTLRDLDSTISEGLRRERLMATLSGLLGVLGILIAVIGLYGVLSYLVLQRTNEIGVRLALGARRSDIVAMVFRQARSLVGVGLAVGSFVAMAIAGSAQSLVFGVHPRGLGTLILACGLLGSAAMVASYLPARRAARLEALAALRRD